MVSIAFDESCLCCSELTRSLIVVLASGARSSLSRQTLQTDRKRNARPKPRTTVRG